MPAIHGGGTSPYVRVSLYVLISGYTLSRYHLKLRHFSLWRRASRSDTSPKSTPGFCKAGSEAGQALGCAEPRQPRPQPRVGELRDPQAPGASPPSGFLVWEPPVLPGPCKVQGSRADGKGLASLASLQQVPPETGLAFSRPLAACVGLACLSCPAHSPGR